jgi:hypothetical protein
MSKLLPNKRRVRDRKIRKLTLPKSADEFFALPEQSQTDYEKSLRVLSKMRTEGLSLKQGTKQADIKLAIVRGIAGRNLKPRSNSSYAVSKTDSLLRVMMMPTSEGMREISLRNSRQASTLGRYSDAVQKYIRTGDASELRKFRHKILTDASGVKFSLITEQKELDRLGSAGVLSFEQIYARSA